MQKVVSSSKLGLSETNDCAVPNDSKGIVDEETTVEAVPSDNNPKTLDHRKSNLILIEHSDDDDGRQEGGERPSCTICLKQYEINEEICWSHNPDCNHFFHRGCIEEWLLRHNECPCCRNNYMIPPPSSLSSSSSTTVSMMGENSDAHADAGMEDATRRPASFLRNRTSEQNVDNRLFLLDMLQMMHAVHSFYVASARASASTFATSRQMETDAESPDMTESNDEETTAVSVASVATESATERWRASWIAGTDVVS